MLDLFQFCFSIAFYSLFFIIVQKIRKQGVNNCTKELIIFSSFYFPALIYEIFNPWNLHFWYQYQYLCPRLGFLLGLYTRNARVASVATVVVVGVKLPRPPRVERGRRRWVGLIRRRLPGHGLTFLPGVLHIPACTSIDTPVTQTSPAAASSNVSAH